MRSRREALTKADILALFPGLSPRQLQRWQRSHRIEPPAQAHRRGLRGSETVYSARAVEQIRALFDASGRGKSSKSKRVRVGYRKSEEPFVLFWEGHDALVPDPRAVIRDTLAPTIQLRANVGAQEPIEEEASFADETSEEIETEYGKDRAVQFVEEHFSGNEGAVRRKLRLGRMRDAEVASFAYAAMSLFFGSLTPNDCVESEGESYAGLLFRGYGLGGSREYPSLLPGAKDTTEQASLIARTRDMLERVLSEEFLQMLSVEELRQARDDLRDFIDDFVVFGNFLSRLVGPKALGLANQTKRLASATVGERASLVLLWLYVRKTMPENCEVLRAGMGRAAKTIRETSRAFESLSPSQQKSVKAAMRLAARSGFQGAQSTPAMAVGCVCETRNDSA